MINFLYGFLIVYRLETFKGGFLVHLKFLRFFKIFIIFVSFFGRINSFEEPISPKEIQFINKNRLPFKQINREACNLFSNQEIINAIQTKNLDILKNCGFKFYSTWGNIVMEHPNLDGWVIKTGSRFGNNSNNIMRISKANKLRKYINNNGYKDLTVPNHYLFHIPGKDLSLNNKNYLVFCEKMDISDKNLGHLTDQQVNEICLLIRETGMCDTRGENIKLLKDGRIAFIDTEPFLELNTSWWKVIEKFGLRVIKGAVGAHIFRRAVSRDRKINRKLIMANNVTKDGNLLAQTNFIKISFFAIQPLVISVLDGLELDKYLI